MRGTALAFNRFLALLLSFLLGFMSFAGILVGAGYLVYSQLSVDNLNKLGLNIRTEEFIDPSAEKALTGMTIKGMIEEIQYLSEMGGELDLDALIERYGLKLDEETMKIIPDGVRAIPLSDLFGPEGGLILLDNVEVSYVLGLIPGDVLAEPMLDALSDNTLRDIVDLDLAYLFDGVDLGYLVGVTYEKNESGEYEIVYAEEGNPTFLELLAPLDLGGLLSSMADGETDILAVLGDSLEDMSLADLYKAFSSPEEEIPAFLEGKTLGQIITEDENGESKFDIALLFEGEKLGTLMGYEYKDITPDDNEVNPEWVLKDSTDSADPMIKALCDIELSELLAEDADPMQVVMDEIGENKMGDIMGYTYVDDTADGIENGVWQDSDGNEPDSITKSLCSIKLSDLISDEADPMDTIMDSLGTNTLGEIMGYTYVDGEWVTESGEPADELFQAICGVELEALMNSESGENPIIEAFGESGTTLGGLMGYTLDPVTNEWVDDNGAPADSLFAALCGVKLYDLMEGDDPSGIIMEALDGTTLGEIMGYTLDPVTNEWVDDNGEPADALFAALCGINLYHLTNPEQYKDSEGNPDPDVNNASDVIMKAFEDSGTALGDIMGYTKEGDKWYSTDDNGVKTEITGVGAIVADYSLYEIMNDGLDTDEIMSELTIAKVYNLEKVDNLPVYLDNTLLDGFTFDVWFDNDQPASAIIAALAEYNVDELNTKIDTLKIADVIGLVEYEGKYYKWTVVGGKNGYITLELDDSLTAEFASLTLKSFQGNAQPGEDTVDSIIDGIKLHKVLGYHKENGKWYTKDNQEVSGILASLADSEVGNLTVNIENLRIGAVAEYERVGEDEFGNGIWEGENGSKPSGIIAAIADLTVKEITSESALSNKIQKVEVGTLLGYELKEDGKWYQKINGVDTEVTGITGAIAGFTVEGLDSGINTIEIGKLLGYTYIDNTNDGEKNGTWYEKQNGNLIPVSGIMGSVAGFEVGTLQDNIGTITIGSVVGFTKKDDGKWYDGDKLASGILGSMADLTIDDLKNENTLADKLKTVEIGDIMGYVQDNDKWYSVDEFGNKTEVAGIMAIIAGSKATELDSTINNTELGDLLEFKKVNGEWALDSDGAELSFLMRNMAGKKLNEVGLFVSNLALADLFTEEDLNSGYLSLFPNPEDVTLKTLPDDLNSVFENATLGQFQTAGMIDENVDLSRKVLIGTEWVELKDLHIDDLIKVISNPQIPSIP